MLGGALLIVAATVPGGAAVLGLVRGTPATCDWRGPTDPGPIACDDPIPLAVVAGLMVGIGAVVIAADLLRPRVRPWRTAVVGLLALGVCWGVLHLPGAWVEDACSRAHPGSTSFTRTWRWSVSPAWDCAYGDGALGVYRAFDARLLHPPSAPPTAPIPLEELVAPAEGRPSGS